MFNQMGKVDNMFSAFFWRWNQIVHTIWDLVAFNLKKNLAHFMGHDSEFMESFLKASA